MQSNGQSSAPQVSAPTTKDNVARDQSTHEELERDDFGLPIRKHKVDAVADDVATSYPASSEGQRKDHDTDVNGLEGGKNETETKENSTPGVDSNTSAKEQKSKSEDDIKNVPPPTDSKLDDAAGATATVTTNGSTENKSTSDNASPPATQNPSNDAATTESKSDPKSAQGHKRGKSSVNGISEWSHQHMASQPVEEDEPEDEGEWQEMPAFAPYDMYDDDNRLIAREAHESDDENAAYAGLGGAGKGYTRVQLDEDAQSATSMDENTSYLFKEAHGTGVADAEDEEARDAVSQMQATKDLLTETQRIAYVGMTRLALSDMCKQAEAINLTKGSRKEVQMAAEATRMWSQKMMVRLYAHMDISTAEQIMIEQLAEHGVEPNDLRPTLMQNARVKNPMAANHTSSFSINSQSRTSMSSLQSPRASISSPRLPESVGSIHSPRGSISSSRLHDEESANSPPPYMEHEGDDLPEVRTPSQLPTTKNIDIDLRWTILCDLFLTLIADSIYDARSRVLLERVGSHLEVSWLEICRFEKRVTDALEMQQAAEKENWNEDEHKEHRRKMALKKRYMMMGLATVGGSLVIGLSAGLLAPVIGAGLAAGFTTIGVAGTSGFLAGAGGAAIITSTAAASGGVIAVRAANRRTGAVKTFEYRPLHNNKRVNLIITVSGWMTGKVDDVRLPYSTVDPVMGDIYSVLWEPEMLTSMGDTINILATEALTQGLQQVLGSTILIGLMAALQLPVVLTKLAYLIDNPWTVSLDRANSAGLILADSIIDRNLGTRPITLVGYSLGSRVIFSCLRELARKGAFGLVQNVYLFGSPIVANRDDYLKARAVVSGRFVNGYARNDWILGYLFRLTSGGISRVAGLAPVDKVPGLENIDVTDLVPGHMAYRTAMPRLLREVGWLVESDEFSEIEDPDPENHQQRQRELINEIEEARKAAEKEQKNKGKFGFFKKRKNDRKEWETYQETKEDEAGPSTREKEYGNVLFDVDAIRAELASEQMEVKELKSTLPPMKLDMASSSTLTPPQPLRASKSFDSSTLLPSRQSTTPSPVPPLHSPWANSTYDLHDYDEFAPQEEISMTFESNFERRNPLPVPPKPDQRSRASSFQRPELKSSVTMPTGSGLGLGIERNAWAEDEDEFAEKEIAMTFA